MISFYTAFVAVILGLVLATILVYVHIPLAKILIYILIIPLLIPPYLHAFSWMHFLMILGDYRLLGILQSTGAALLRSNPGVILILVFSYFPIAFFTIYLTLLSIPWDLIDNALLITRPLKLMRKVILRLLVPTVIFSFIFIFTITFTTFDVPAFLGTKTYMTQIYSTINLGQDTGKVLFLNLIPLSITLLLWAMAAKLLSQKRPFLNFCHQNQTSNNYCTLAEQTIEINDFLFVV